MLQTHQRLFLAALAAFSLRTILALSAAVPQGTSSVNSDERVLSAPYSAKRRFTHDEKSSDGTIKHTETNGSKARDSQGRMYSADERLWLYLGTFKSEMLYEINDPVNHTDTRWDTSTSIAKVISEPAVSQSNNSILSNNPFLPQCQTCTPGDLIEAVMVTSGAKVEKLGMRTMGGFVAEGRRTTNGQSIHESWYCPELKIVILTIDDNPGTGHARDELVDITRGEPDTTKYMPPPGYAIQKIELPSANSR
jgi:hypothetical protein